MARGSRTAKTQDAVGRLPRRTPLGFRRGEGDHVQSAPTNTEASGFLNGKDRCRARPASRSLASMNMPFADVTQVHSDATATGVIVAGMHRSGTSALTRVLSILGAELPKTLMQAGADNPKGFWESTQVADLNESLLSSLGSSWDDVLAFLLRRDGLRNQPHTIGRIAEVLGSEFSLTQLFVLKDPRLALLLDAWVAAFKEKQLAARIVIAVRNPLEVASSLAARNQFSVGRSLLLWLSYSLSAERASRNLPRVIVSYQDLIDDWRGVARRIESEFGLRFTGWTPTAELEIDAFVSPHERHEVSSAELLRSRADVVRWVKDTYEWMLEAARGENPAPARLDAIAAEAEVAIRVFAPLISEQRAIILRHAEAIRAAAAEHDALVEREAAQKAEHDAVRRRIADLEDNVVERHAKILALEQTLGDKEDAAAEQSRMLSDLSEYAARRESKLRERAEEGDRRLAAAEAELATAYSERHMLAEQLKASKQDRANQAEQLAALRAEHEILGARLSEAQAARAALADELDLMQSSRVNVQAALDAARADRAHFEAHAASEAQKRSEEFRDQLNQRDEEARARSRQADLAVAEAVLPAASAAKNFRDAESARRHAIWSKHGLPRKRGARLFRAPVIKSALRRSWQGRAAALLSSGLYVPQDGPGGRGIVAYARGDRRASSPHPIFDEAWYRASGKTGALLPAIHYLWYGDAEGRDPHPLFDVAWYRAQHHEAMAGWKLTSLEHYLMRGARRGFAPHPLFSTTYYVPQAEDVFARAVNPLAHYLRLGWRDGIDPHPLFSTRWYDEQYPDVKESGIPALVHFVQAGASEGRDPHPLFSTAFYLETNQDVRRAGINPLVHYLTQGWREGRRPSPHFDPRAYLRENPDVERAGVEPLTHYVLKGAWERRGGAEPFDVADICAKMPGAILGGMTPLEAWVRLGAHQPDRQAPAAMPIAAPVVQSGVAEARALDDNYDWGAYKRLSAAIQNEERQRIESLQLPAFDLVGIDAQNLRQAAARISLKPAADPDVTIIIPVYNQIKYTLECLASIAQAPTPAAFEILVVDDGSSDETESLVRAVDGVRYVRNEKNLGYLRSVNRAAGLARGKTLIILNNDTQVRGDWLAPLLQELADPTVGVAAPKLLYPNGRLQEAGARLTADGGAKMIGLFDDPRLARYGYSRDVDYVSGACFAVRRADFDAINGFDDRYAPAYCEDSDFCMRVRAVLGKRVRYVAASEVCHHLSVTSDAQPNTYKMRQATTNQQKLLERWGEELSQLNDVRVVSFYLPQFHAIPENDRWWGAGFTEWRNVTRATPNFVGHYQPRLPGELGFYDLTNPETMNKQAALAREYGLHGFCYYYYWFSGRRVLEMPTERLLETGRPDIPFCLCWANENWTRTWDGQHKDILLEQRYSSEDDTAIITDMMRFFKLPNYIRINGKPLLIVYRPQLFPAPQRTAELWRRACREAGIGEIYLAMVEVFEHALTYPSPRAFGFDASIEFPPAGTSEPMRPHQMLNPNFAGAVSDYHQVVRRYMREALPGHVRFRGVMPSWDNTARRQDNAHVFSGASPGAFQAWLEAVIEQTRAQNFGDERIVFVNAWNEWAEGAHLEPDMKYGRGWLEAVRNALAASQLLKPGM